MSDNLTLAGRQLRLARRHLVRATNTARTETHMAARTGISERDIARALNVSRKTIQNWLGETK